MVVCVINNCASVMKAIKAREIYQHNNVLCNVCCKEFDDNTKFYHCENTTKHEKFDVCHMCWIL